MAILIGQYAVTGTAVDVFTALGLTAANPGQARCQYLSIQYNQAATAAAFLGTSAVTTAPANVGWKFPLVAANIPSEPFILQSPQASSGIDLRSIYLIGTANAANLFFIVAVI